MDDKKWDELIRRSMEEERNIPADLSKRMEATIDALAKREEETAQHAPNVSLIRRYRGYWISGIAAALLIGIALFFLLPDRPKGMEAYAVKDPQQAERVTEQALAMVSAKWNKGMEQLDHSEASIRKANNTINEVINQVNNENN